MTTRVAPPRCEKNQSDLSYICLYTVTIVNRNGVALDAVPDIKSRVWQWTKASMSETTRLARQVGKFKLEFKNQFYLKQQAELRYQ